MSIQPINIYLTKKKTGSDGFVGVEGRSKDNSVGFKVLKGVAGAGFGAIGNFRNWFERIYGKNGFQRLLAYN